MKKTDFNALLTHIETELNGYTRHYKLYSEVYMLKNKLKTKGIELRFRTCNLLQIQKYSFIKDDQGKNIDLKITHDSCYKLTAIQSVKMLKLLEEIC